MLNQIKKYFTIFAVLSMMTFTTTNASALSICGGAEGGQYDRTANQIAQAISSKYRNVDVDVIQTNGSLDNIERFDDKECSIALVQQDALSVQPPSRSFKTKGAHTEVVYWFYNLKHGVEDLEDIEHEPNLRLVIIEGSGSDVTFQNFVAEDSGYEKRYQEAVIADDFYDAMDIVAEGSYTLNGKKVKIAGAIYTTRPGVFDSEVVQDFRDKIGVGELTDGDFNDAKDTNGERLYVSCEIDKSHVKGLTRATFGSQDTICMRAQVIYATDLKGVKAKKFKRILNKVLR